MLRTLRRLLREVLPGPAPIVLCPGCELRVEHCHCPPRPPAATPAAHQPDTPPSRAQRLALLPLTGRGGMLTEVAS